MRPRRRVTRLRALFAATLVASGPVGLVALTSAPAQAVTPTNCRWTGDPTVPPQRGAEGFITAGPLLEPSANVTVVMCNVRRWSIDGPLIGGVAQFTPGPAGVVAAPATLDPVDSGDPVYICTSTSADFGPAQFRGCSLAFTA